MSRRWSGFRDLDGLGLLKDVTSLNFHPHLPHYAVTDAECRHPCAWHASRWTSTGRILSRRPANTAFNCLLWMPPAGDRGADIVLVDSTHFTTLFGATREPQEFLEKPGADEVSGGMTSGFEIMLPIFYHHPRSAEDHTRLLRLTRDTHRCATAPSWRCGRQ